MTSDRSRIGSRLHLWLERLRQRIRQRIRHEPQDKPQLLELLRDAKQRSVLDTDALSMIEGVLQVSDLRVGDIMIPRAEMTYIRRDDPFDQILKVVVETAHSRFPVIGDDKGDVVGVLIAKDLLAFCGSDNRRPFILRDLVRSAVFVPESKRLNVLLKEFRSSRSHMAIVVDEYGTAAGLVTIEDVLEQIVGEIDDEHDYDEGAFIYRRSANEYTIKARTTIEDFNAYFDCDLPDEEFDTIGGLVVHAMGRLPKGGERVRVEGFRFTVKRADSRRVHLLTVERIEPADEGEDLPEGPAELRGRRVATDPGLGHPAGPQRGPVDRLRSQPPESSAHRPPHPNPGESPCRDRPPKTSWTPTPRSSPPQTPSARASATSWTSASAMSPSLTTRAATWGCSGSIACCAWSCPRRP